MWLVCLTWVAGILYYLMSRDERSLSFASFVIGTFLGLVSCIVLTLIHLDGLEYSASVVTETFRIYLTYFFIPLVISIPLFLLMAFSLSEDTLLQLPSMMAGLFTVIFIGAVFTHRAEPETFRAEILLLLMFSAIFIAELLLKLFLNLLSSLSSIAAFIIAVVCLLAVLFALSLILGAYYFNNAQFVTILLAIAVLGLAIVSQRVFSFFR